MTKEEQATNNPQPGRLESPERLNDYVKVTSVSPLLALDNVTQQRVAEHLAKMKCTRIMISQRPENLRFCDRIITLTSNIPT